MFIEMRVGVALALCSYNHVGTLQGRQAALESVTCPVREAANLFI